MNITERKVSKPESLASTSPQNCHIPHRDPAEPRWMSSASGFILISPTITLCTSTPIPTSPPPKSSSYSLWQCQKLKMEAESKERLEGDLGTQLGPKQGLDLVQLQTPTSSQPSTKPMHLHCFNKEAPISLKAQESVLRYFQAGSSF